MARATHAIDPARFGSAELGSFRACPSEGCGGARVKFAFIAPRYGADVAAGAEHACRLLAEQVSERHDVDVLTTCARDPRTWKNEYAEGSDRVRGVLVRHFPVSQPHDRAAFEQFSSRLFTGPRARSEE